MTFLNKIELRGIVGNSTVARIGDTEVCRFSLVTEYASRDIKGNLVMESTWFNVTAFAGKGMPADLNQVAKGTVVFVRGRVRSFKYTEASGAERTGWEIVARGVEIVNED